MFGEATPDVSGTFAGEAIRNVIRSSQRRHPSRLECRVKFAAILGTTDANSPSTHVDFLPGRRGWALPAGRSRPSRHEPRRGGRRIRYRVANPAPGHHLPGECLV